MEKQPLLTIWLSDSFFQNKRKVEIFTDGSINGGDHLDKLSWSTTITNYFSLILNQIELDHKFEIDKLKRLLESKNIPLDDKRIIYVGEEVNLKFLDGHAESIVIDSLTFKERDELYSKIRNIERQHALVMEKMCEEFQKKDDLMKGMERKIEELESVSVKKP